MFQVLFDTYFRGINIGRAISTETFDSIEEAEEFADSKFVRRGILSYKFCIVKIPTYLEWEKHHRYMESLKGVVLDYSYNEVA